MSNSYFSLLTLEDDFQWYIQFGDYDREVVEDEYQEYRDNGHKAKRLKIIATGSSQDEINAAVRELNL